jgi:hypothetical protein
MILFNNKIKNEWEWDNLVQRKIIKKMKLSYQQIKH